MGTTQIPLSKKKTYSFLENNWPYFLFLVIMIIQHNYIYLYHDDFGYASLSYVGNLSNNIQGHYFTFTQMLSFIHTHYLEWGGRIVPLFFLLSLLRHSLWVYRIFQSIVLTMILFFAGKLIEITDIFRNNSDIKISIVFLSLYGLIPIELHNNGTYWASASIMYVWPFLFIFAAGYLLRKQNNKSKMIFWLLLPLLFLGVGLSQEQIFFPAFFMLLGFWFDHIIKNRVISLRKMILLCMSMLIIGFCLLMFSPGNRIRRDSSLYSMFYAKSLQDQIIYNFPSFLQITFGKQNFIILIFWLISNILFLARGLGNKNKINKIYILQFALHIIYTIIFIYIVSRQVDLFFLTGDKFYFSVFFWISFFIVVSIPGLIFSYHNKSFSLFGLYIGGSISQLATLLMPTINPRSSLIFLFALFPLLASMITDQMNKTNKYIKYIFIILLITSSVINTTNIISGYKSNAYIHNNNKQTLVWARISIEQGLNINNIQLKKLVDDNYAGAMPYTPNYGYINTWIKDYYMLPQNVNISWE